VSGRTPAGLLALSAVPGTSAHRAGLGDGGNLIVAVNGMPVGNSLAGYCDSVSGARSGDRVTFSVLLPGASRPRKVVITLE
jgi:S1-C subfamily serine protease